jgi:hypothetical protein
MFVQIKMVITPPKNSKQNRPYGYDFYIKRFAIVVADNPPFVNESKRFGSALLAPKSQKKQVLLAIMVSRAGRRYAGLIVCDAIRETLLE